MEALRKWLSSLFRTWGGDLKPTLTECGKGEESAEATLGVQGTIEETLSPRVRNFYANSSRSLRGWDWLPSLYRKGDLLSVKWFTSEQGKECASRVGWGWSIMLWEGER